MEMRKKKQIEMERMIVFKAPKEFAEKLEQYCRINGYSISYAVRKAVEQHILTPNFTWADLVEWAKDVDRTRKATTEALTLIYEELKEQRTKLRILFRILEEMTGIPIRQIMAEELQKASKEG